MHIDMSEKWLPVYEALASKVRLKIIHLLAQQEMNVRELADKVGLSSAIMTTHVRKLEKAGIVKTDKIPGKGGIQKRCRLNVRTINVTLPDSTNDGVDVHRLNIPVGCYTDFDVHPTCGLATPDKIIGLFDDPRFFSDPERIKAHILWFGRGYIEYKFPNHILKSQSIEKIEISFEISSEAPLAKENWPSDITFSLNGIHLGTWTSPGDFADRRGRYTPSWWSPEINQYGLLKILRVTNEGSFIDGEQISSVTLRDIPVDLHWTLRFSVDEGAQHVGGFTLYGSEFGNYNQDILFKVYFRNQTTG